MQHSITISCGRLSGGINKEWKEGRKDEVKEGKEGRKEGRTRRKKCEKERRKQKKLNGGRNLKEGRREGRKEGKGMKLEEEKKGMLADYQRKIQKERLEFTIKAHCRRCEMMVVVQRR